MIRIYLLLLTIVLTLVSIGSAYAQKTAVGNWFIYFGNQQINKQWNWWNEMQYRNYNFAGDLEQLVLRTGIGYNLTENNNNVMLGYGFFLSEPYVNNGQNKTQTTEHRIFQQFLTKQNFGRVFIQHRYRLEERILQNDFKMRVRYFLSLNIPFNKPKLDKGAVYFSGYNELFINLQQPLYDRDRVYLAFGYAFNKFLRLELGGMYQIFENSSRPQFQIVFFNNLPFRSAQP